MTASTGKRTLPASLSLPFLVLLTVSLASDAAAQSAGRVSIPRTRATVEVPERWIHPENAPIVLSPDTRMTVTILETAMPRDLAAINYAHPDTLKKGGFTVLRSPDSVLVDGIPGYRFYLHKSYGLLRNEGLVSQVWIVGDTAGSLTIIVAYPDTAGQESIDRLASIAESIRWNRTGPLNPMSLLHFALDVDSSFVPFGAGPDWMLFLRGERSDDPAARSFLLMKTHPHPGGTMREEQHERLMESLLENADPNLTITSVLEFNKLTLDGIQALETVSSGRWADSDSTVAVYGALIFHPLAFITLIGTSDPGNTDACIAALRETVRSFRRSNPAADPPTSCDSLLGRGAPAEAAACFDAALKRNPESLGARLGLADALREQGKHQEAATMYGEVLASDAGIRRAYLGRARASAALRSYARAREDYARAAAFDRRDVSILVEKSGMEKESGSYREAREDLEEAIALRPDSAGLRVLLSEYLPHAEAMKAIDTALAMDSLHGPAYERRGVRNLMAGNFSRAVRDFSSAIANGRATSFVYASRGTANHDLGRLDAAIADFDRAVSLNKRDTMAQQMRAFALGLAGRFEQSRRGFEAALLLDSTQWLTSFTYGIVLYLEGSYREAAARFRTAAGGTTTGEVRAWLYFAEFKAHGPDAARKNLNAYASSRMTTPDEEWLDIVKFLLKSISEEELLARARKTRIDPDNPYGNRRTEALCDAYFGIGMGYHVTGRKVGAKPWWKKCLETEYSRIVSYSVADAITRGILKEK